MLRPPLTHPKSPGTLRAQQRHRQFEWMILQRQLGAGVLERPRARAAARSARRPRRWRASNWPARSQCCTTRSRSASLSAAARVTASSGSEPSQSPRLATRAVRTCPSTKNGRPGLGRGAGHVRKPSFEPCCSTQYVVIPQQLVPAWGTASSRTALTQGVLKERTGGGLGSLPW